MRPEKTRRDTGGDTAWRLSKAKAIQLLHGWMVLEGVERVADRFIPVYENNINYLLKTGQMVVNGEGKRLRQRMKSMRAVRGCLLISTVRKSNPTRFEIIDNRADNLDRILTPEMVDIINETLITKWKGTN